MAYNKKAVLAANTEAIRVVLRLEKERREATEAEKGILRGYQGFGGLKCVLNRTDTPDDIRYWSKSEQNLFEPTQQLKQILFRLTPIAYVIGIVRAVEYTFQATEALIVP